MRKSEINGAATRTNHVPVLGRYTQRMEVCQVVQVLSAATLVDASGFDLAGDAERQFPDKGFQIMIIAPIISDCIESPAPGIHKRLERPVTSSGLIRR